MALSTLKKNKKNRKNRSTVFFLKNKILVQEDALFVDHRMTFEFNERDYIDLF